MSCRKPGLRRRSGFTLVELLVVISIIGMLMALLLPAVQQAREAGRRNTCQSNMKQLALAVTNFAGAKGSYPGYVEPLLLASTAAGGSGSTSTTTGIYPVSWFVPILPYMERTDVYTLWRNQPVWASSGIQGWSDAIDPPPVYMDVLNCPSTPPSNKQSNTPTVYVANSGMVDVLSAAGATPYPSDFQANGVFFNHYNPAQVLANNTGVTPYGATTTVAGQVLNPGPIVSTSQDYITVHDGSSLTLMLSENNYAPWASPPGGSGTLSTTAVSGATYNGQAFWGTALAVAQPYAAGTEEQNCFVFWPDQQPQQLMKINSQQTVRAQATGSGTNGAGNQVYWTMAPSSNHPTGVDVSFCDGHTRFISQDIDYTVFCLLMTPWGQMCNTPGTASGFDTGSSPNGTIYYPSGTNNYGFLRNKPIDESAIN